MYAQRQSRLSGRQIPSWGANSGSVCTETSIDFRCFGIEGEYPPFELGVKKHFGCLLQRLSTFSFWQDRNAVENVCFANGRGGKFIRVNSSCPAQHILFWFGPHEFRDDVS